MEHMRRLVIIVGAPGSGKDELIRAVDDMGTYHAQIIPKHTSRERWDEDREEMLCPGDDGHNLSACGITYENYGDTYGIVSGDIWEGLKKGVFQVVVVSNMEAINKLREHFGELVLLVYVHSNRNAQDYRKKETSPDKEPEYIEYIENRADNYEMAYNLFLENYMAFDHVLINSGLPENLFDQMFRLFRSYERGDIAYYGSAGT